MNTTELQSCPLCGIQVKSLEKHKAKAHDPLKLAERRKAELDRQSREISDNNREILEKARKHFLATLVRCGSCREQVEIQLLPNHYFVVHKSSLPPEMRAIYGLAEPQNMFKSASAREKYWRNAMGMEAIGEDIYDKGLTVQGGAFGLGKNRKH